MYGCWTLWFFFFPPSLFFFFFLQCMRPFTVVGFYPQTVRPSQRWKPFLLIIRPPSVPENCFWHAYLEIMFFFNITVYLHPPPPPHYTVSVHNSLSCINIAYTALVQLTEISLTKALKNKSERMHLKYFCSRITWGFFFFKSTLIYLHLKILVTINATNACVYPESWLGS